jgi:small subunit ribosomal protein S6
VGQLQRKEYILRETQAARYYEMMVITTPEITPEEITATTDQITGYIASAGGSILRANQDSPWGRRRLAYPFRHESHDVRDGFYTLFHLELDPSRIDEIERELRLNDSVMRYLLLQLPGEPIFPPEPEAEPAAGETEGQGSELAATDAAAAGEEEQEVEAADEATASEAAESTVDETAAEGAAEPFETNGEEAPENEEE